LLMFAKISAYNYLVLSLWACDEMEPHGQECVVQQRYLHLGGRKAKEKGEGPPPPQGTPPIT
jgi:hypothetical protein